MICSLKCWSMVAAVLSGSAFAAGAFLENFDTASPVNFSYGSGGKKASFTHISGMESPDEAGTYVRGLGSARIIHPTRPATLGVIPLASKRPAPGIQKSGPKDVNQNGIADNSEIDFEWLIADRRNAFRSVLHR